MPVPGALPLVLAMLDCWFLRALQLMIEAPPAGRREAACQLS